MEAIKSAQNILVTQENEGSADSLITDLKEKTSGNITVKLISEITGTYS